MKRTLSTKIAAVGTGLAGLALAGGLVATAAHASSTTPKLATAAVAYQAATPSPGSTTDTNSDAATNDDGTGAAQSADARSGDEHRITGSVKAPESGTEQSESAEQAALAPLAKITAADAQAAAVKAHPGATAGTAILQDADGYVVYQVPVTVNGQTHKVVVDAGNGRVLATEQADGTEAAEGQEGPEQSQGQDVPEAGDTPEAPGGSGTAG